MSKTLQRGTLLVIPDHEIVRHPSLAYQDGYADARALGTNGMFMDVRYQKSDREAYLLGFKRGLRVHRVNNR